MTAGIETRDIAARKLRRLGTASLALAIAVLLSTVWTAWTNLGEARKEFHATERTRALLQNLDTLLSSLKDAETGQRGYLLTGDTRYLEPYKNALASIQQAMESVRHSAADAPELHDALSRLTVLVPQKLAELEPTIRLRETQGAQAALDVVRTDRGKALMDQVRAESSGESNREYARLEERARMTQAHQTSAAVIALLGTSALFVLIIVGLVALDRGVHQREELNREVESARQLLEITLTSIGDGVIATDGAGRVSFINRVAQDLTGFSPTEAQGRKLDDVFRIINENTREPVEDPGQKVLRLGTIVGLANHTLLIRNDGSEVAIDDSGAPIRDRAGALVGVVLVFRDITARREAEKALEESEARLSLALDAAHAGTWDHNLVTQKIVWSAGYLRLFGYELDSVVPSENAWAERVHPDDLAHVRGELDACIAGKNDIRSEYRVIWPDGSIHWIEARGRCSYDSESHAIRIVGAVVETTQRKQAEEALRQVNQELQQFVYSASHDLQEPLRTITSFGQLLVRNHSSSMDGNARELLHFLLEGAARMRMLLQDLLALSRIREQETAMEPVAMNEVFHTTKTMLRAAIDESGADIRAAQLPTVCGNAAQLSQLLQNLFSNSIKYRQAGVPLQVRLTAERDGGRWNFAVRDNGQGFDQENVETVFLPFKRLHGHEVPGTGIGLAICKRIVELHGGRIWAESAVDRGTTIHFTLNAAAEGDEQYLTDL